MVPQNTTTPSAPVIRVRGGGPWRILIVSAVVFGLTLVIWAGMAFGYAPYLRAQVDDIDGELQALSSSITPEEQNDFIDFYSQLYNIDVLSRTHLYPTNVFEFLEEYTYPSVLITSARVQVTDNELRLDGISTSYDVLTDQISMYRDHPDVVNVSLDTSRARAATEGGGVIFSVRVVFTSQFFSK